MPSVHLHVGTIVDDENKMRIFVDTDDVITTGNKVYHQWVMTQYPNMVSEYLECGDNTEYDVVQLLAALDLTGTRQYVDHGSMIAIVRHKSP